MTDLFDIEKLKTESPFKDLFPIRPETLAAVKADEEESARAAGAAGLAGRVTPGRKKSHG